MIPRPRALLSCLLACVFALFACNPPAAPPSADAGARAGSYIPASNAAYLMGKPLGTTTPVAGDSYTYTGTAYLPQGDVFAIPGLKLFYRADLGITTVSGAVSSWVDQTSAALAATQGTAGQRPVYNATDAAYNNQPTLSFTAASTQLLQSASVAALGQPLTICLVGQNDETINGEYMVSFGDNAFTNLVAIAWTNTPGLYIIGQSFAAKTTSASVTSPGIICGTLNGATSAIFTTNSQTADGTGAAGANTITTKISIGGRSDGGSTLNGKLAEVALFAGATNGPLRAAYTAYATRRYGFSAATFQ